MKKLLLTALILSAAVIGKAQNSNVVKNSDAKQDSVIHIAIPVAQYRSLLQAIEINIDSKKNSREIIEFIIKNAKLETQPQPADKPKEAKQ